VLQVMVVLLMKALCDARALFIRVFSFLEAGS